MLLSELKNELPFLHIARDGEFRLTSKLGFSDTKGVLSFIGDPRYLGALSDEVTCVVATEAVLPFLPERLGVVVAEDAKGVFGLIHNATAERQVRLFRPDGPCKTKIGRHCRIHPTAAIAEQNVVLGDHTVIGPHVVIQEDVVIGSDCRIFSGVAIGDAGLEYYRINGRLTHIEHLGRVVIGSNVHIHPNSCVAKAQFVDACTAIGDDVAIDCLVHVGHAVTIGEGVILTAGVVLAGSANIESGAYMGVNCSVKNLITVGKGALVGMGGVVIRDVPPGKTVAGNPTAELIKSHKNQSK